MTEFLVVSSKEREKTDGNRNYRLRKNRLNGDIDDSKLSRKEIAGLRKQKRLDTIIKNIIITIWILMITELDLQKKEKNFGSTKKILK